jgi:hypothetical protein
MSNILKDIAVLIFSAGEEIEKKADQFRKEREDRYGKFEQKLKSGKEKLDTAVEEELDKARDRISAFTEKIGLASKKEIDDLARKIDELSKKIDGMGK